MLKNITRYWLLATAALLVLVSSCTKDFPENVESPDEVILKSIRIVNAGANGNGVVQGVIDENRKTITFPRLDTLTDFSKIKFEGEMSNGAAFDQATYAFAFADGEAAKTQVVKIVNNKRFREYLVTLRLLIPVYGADWGKAEISDYTNNELGNPRYEPFVSLNTRGTGFDGEHVLIVTRHAMGSHLLNVNALRQNNATPIPLNLTGVSGGTFAVNVGAQVKGHTYIANLSSNASTNPIKVYHWTDPSAAPQLIGNIDVSGIAGAGARHGDNLSVNLDDNGNGYMYFGDNA
ncbi:MAG: DUF4623 domain-containing protein, partial [Chitinophagaceae bacterium]